MFHRDTLRLIKKTSNRFFSLFMIVFIGVAFMAGLMATPDIMKESVDLYYDDYHLMDVQLYSSYGFCHDDVKAMRQVEEVDELFASRFTDVYANDGKGNIYVTRLQEVDSSVNEIELTKGRLPENKNEALCLQTSSFGAIYDLGDQITIEKDDLDDYVSSDTFTIVGFCKSPQYMSASKEPSTLDNKDLEAVLYVQNEVLISQYYTTIFLTLDGLSETISYSDDYNLVLNETLPIIEAAAGQQEDYLKNDLIEEAYAEIEKGEKELNEELAKATKEIEDAEAQLEDAHIQLIIGQSQIDLGLKQIEVGKEEIKANEKLLKDAQKQIDSGIKRIEDETGMSFEDAYSMIETSFSIYTALESQLEDLDTDIQRAQAEKASLQNKIVELNQQISEKEALLESYDPELDADQITALETEILELKAEVALNQEMVKALDLVIDGYDGDAILNILKEMDEMAGGSVEESYLQMRLLKDSIVEVEEGFKQLEAGKKELETSEQLLAESQKEINKGKAEYNQGKKDLDEAKKTLNDEIEKAQAEIAKAKQDIEELPEASWMVLDRKSIYSAYMYDNTIGQMTAICITVPFMFYLVAALVCMTTMTRLIDEQRSQIGIFSAIGISKRQIISKYLIYALIATALASIIAVPAGIALFPRVIYEVWRLMYDLPNMYFMIPLLPTLFCLLAFTLLTLVVSYFVASKTLKEKPSELMRPKAPKKAKKVFLEHIHFIWKRLSFTSKITARNLIRYKTRFFMTVLGVAGCTGLLVLGFGIKDSISDIIHLQFEEVFTYNATVNLENDHELEEIIKTLEDNYDHSEIVPFEAYSSKVYLDANDKTIQVHVYDAREINRVMDLKERQSQEALRIDLGGVVISEKFAKVNDLKVGDFITLESSEGIKGDVEVQGICEMYFQHYLFMSNDTYMKIFDENVHPNSIAVYTSDMDALNKEVEGFDTVISTVDFKPMISSFTTMLEALDFIIAVITLAAGSLALVVLMNLTQVNISERIREIATLKVLGFREGEVSSYIFKEILLLSIIGGLVGLPLGKLMHTFVMTVIDMDMVMFGTNITLFSYAISFAITMIFTFLVLLSMRKTLKKVEMVESLKSIE